MPRAIWVCEICGRRFDDRAGAEACEARGRPQGVPPLGTIFMLGESDERYLLIGALCGAWVVETNAHLLDCSCWVTRDVKTEGGAIGATRPHDNVIPEDPKKRGETCDAGFWLPDDGGRPDHRWQTPPRDAPAFKRMVAKLRARGVTPMIWISEPKSGLGHAEPLP
jgi:hypothetical protein